MAYRSGTDFAKVETTVGTLPAIREHTVDSIGEIPPNLAAMTMLLLMLHRVNGDLAWVADMVAEVEEDDRVLARDEASVVRPGQPPMITIASVAKHFPPSAARDFIDSVRAAEHLGDALPQGMGALVGELERSFGDRS